LSTSFPSTASYHTGWSILPEEVIRNIERALQNGKLLEVIPVTRAVMERVSRTPVSIAVTGDSGNGMSSFVNALRDIGHEEETSAPTGVVRTTQTRACYSSSLFPNVVLWDLPGMGATTQSFENYLDEMQFSQYDLFIIIASEQFSMNHVKLAKTLKGMGKRFYVVWTKLDRDLSTSVLSHTQTRKNIRENVQENLQWEGLRDPSLFLVSNLDPLLHDFPKLRDTLQKDLSNIRYHAPLEALSQICENIVNDKVTDLKERIAKERFQDFLDIRDVDDLREVLEAYRLCFGIDDQSLHQVAHCMGKMAIEYRAITKSQDLRSLCSRDWKLKIMTCLIMTIIPRLRSCASCLCRPITCCLRYMSRPVIRCIRRMTHRRILELIAEDTKTVLKKILEDSTIPA
jgi:immunity-related GTPase family M protein